MRARLRLVAAVAALAVTAGCATPARRQADLELVAGRPAVAAVAYEALLDSPLGPVDEDVVLLQAATAHALANLERGDFDRSRDLLAELVVRYPQSPRRPAADLLLELLRRLEVQAEVLAEARATADDLVASARQRRRKEVADDERSADLDIEALREALGELERQLDRLRAESRARESELVKLRREIEMLKAIDLDQAPPPPDD